MSRPASLWIALVAAAMTALVAGPLALAKVPPDVSFRACGASDCNTLLHDARQGAPGFEVMAAAFRPGVPRTSAGTHPWIRVDVSFDAVPGRLAREALSHFERRFPVVYLPDEGLVGVLDRIDEYRWAQLGPREARAYEELAGGVRPFPAQRLADLDPASVASMDAGDRSAPAGPAGGAGMSVPPLWVVLLLALGIGSLAVAGLATTVNPPRGTPLGGGSAPRCELCSQPTCFGLCDRAGSPRRDKRGSSA